MPDKRFLNIGSISHNIDHIELIIWDHEKQQAEVLPSGWQHAGEDYRQLRDTILGKPDDLDCNGCAHLATCHPGDDCHYESKGDDDA